MTSCDLLLQNATVLNAQGEEEFNQALAVKDGLISWYGPQNTVPEALISQAKSIQDCQGRLLTPGLIDCHTHLVYASHRAGEFKMRMAGVSYADIAKAGGGILSTVKATRKASEDELIEQALPRVRALLQEGVTTVEIKSGYGLDFETEIKMLRVARRLGEITGLRVRTTFLGAHALAPEYKDNPQGYVDLLCKQMLPKIADLRLADAVDVFCESIAFNKAQTEQIFTAARALNMPIKCHAEQLSNSGASLMAAKMGALSCDHLEYLDEPGALAMAEAGTVAVLLPGAYYYLRETRKPPVDLLRQKGVGIAIATDSNPGSSPTCSLLLMLNMACQFFALTVPEALSAVTYQAAKALGLEKETGTIAVGMKADLNLWQINESALLCYYFAVPFAHQTMIDGQWLDA